MSKYSREEKLEMIREYEEKHWSIQEISEAHGISASIPRSTYYYYAKQLRKHYMRPNFRLMKQTVIINFGGCLLLALCLKSIINESNLSGIEIKPKKQQCKQDEQVTNLPKRCVVIKDQFKIGNNSRQTLDQRQATPSIPDA